MRTSRRVAPAFTLVEMMIAGGLVAVFGVVVYAIMSIGMTLYTQNVSIGQTQSGGLVSTEKLMLKVAAAAEVPILVDDTGATLVGNGPAAGVSFFCPASAQAYPVPSAVSATDMSFTVTKSSSQLAPQTGDKITMSDLGFQGLITSVSSAGNSSTVGFASTVGSGFSPAKTAGTVIPAGSKCFLISPSAFISVNAVLRFYSRALSVAQQGSTAFNDPANFAAIATLLPLGNDANFLPFQYLDPSRRSIDVNLRVRAPAYGSKISDFYTFQNMKTTVAYRSAVTQ
jgi:hypothetical protein